MIRAFHKPWRFWRRTAKTLVGGVGLVAAGLALWAAFVQLTHNVHVVEPGALYRSAQLSPTMLDEMIQAHHIRTVINLRGAAPGEAWYDQEAAAVHDAGVTLVSLPMSANREPDGALLADLIQTLRTAPRPILVHCKSGSDRTGLAAALFELLNEGKTAAEADNQLSFRYGHFPWLTSRTGAMDRTFQRVVESRQTVLKVPADASLQ
ncbi:tyrosine-protein phosphatase [Mesorhizobium sp. INR15]|uniref:tyrosine-protein phosphatase n=1 Tax=Mesorhizobium sp. INR15 TaxID=2654248 RepID=UPI001896713C|nr:tyrosine-protein phosphatase [Mesorhizobium sp. INR15]